MFIDKLWQHFRSPAIQWLYCIHHNKKLNGIVNLPGKSLWYKALWRNLYKASFTEEKTVCFIVDPLFFINNNAGPYLMYLRKKMQDAKFVMFFTDLYSGRLSDHFDLMQVKDRFPLILRCYDVLTSKKLKCDFYLSGVRDEDRVGREGIHYLDEPMSYEDNLKHTVKAKCILELMQTNAVVYTLRALDSLVDKELVLTEVSEKGVSYSVYNVFFSRYLETL